MKRALLAGLLLCAGDAAGQCLDVTTTNFLWRIPSAGPLNPPRSYAYIWTERQPQQCACTFWLETVADQWRPASTLEGHCYPPTTADINRWGCWDVDPTRAGCEWQCQLDLWPGVARARGEHLVQWGPPGDPRCQRDGLWIGTTWSDVLLY